MTSKKHTMSVSVDQWYSITFYDINDSDVSAVVTKQTAQALLELLDQLMETGLT